MTTSSPPDALGFDPGFLGPDLPLPVPAQPVVELAYVHFTVLLDPARRLAAATAVNLDGASLREVDRVDEWRLDPRAPASAQAGEELYARNDLDRGHLVRRRDPVWGPPEVAARANVDTFVYPNAAPQAAVFNQSKELWNGLEDHVLDQARAFRQRLSVLTGPVLAADDPEYRGVQVPRRFWKIAAWSTGDASGATLAAAAFLLDQSPGLDDVLDDGAVRAADEPPPLGPFRTFSVPVVDLVALTGLDLGPLVAADRFVQAPGPSGADLQEDRWVQLLHPEDLDLGAQA